MSNRKQLGAERLFDAMGMIDDVLITEAQTPSFTKEKQARHRRFYAVLTACACLVIAVGLLWRGLWNVLLAENDASAPAETVTNTDKETPVPMVQALERLSESPRTKVASEEELALFDGVAKLIWQMEGEEEYHVISVTSASQARRMQSFLNAGRDTFTPEDAETVGCSVWFSYGDGRVVSPYLKSSEGNVGYGEVFAYSPEVEPHDELIRLIGELAES